MVAQTIAEVVWFFLPALLANAAPVLAAHGRWWPRLNRPLDGGRTWRGRRLLGDHKTVRGLGAGVLFGSVAGMIQYAIAPVVPLGLYLPALPTPGAALLWGALLGFGALLGDALKSLVKRQLNIAPGHSWLVFDQVDIVFGVLLLTQWWHPLPLAIIFFSLISVGCITALTSVIGVYLHIKRSL